MGELALAAGKGDLESVERLLQTSAAIDSKECNDALIKASQNGRADVVKRLLNDKRVDPKFRGSLSLQMACISGRTEIVKLLLEDGRADPTDSENNIIKQISNPDSIAKYGTILDLLIRDGRVDLTVNSNIILQYLIRENKSDLIKLRLQDPRIEIKFENLPNEAISEIIKIAAHSAFYENNTAILTALLHNPNVDHYVMERIVLRILDSLDNDMRDYDSNIQGPLLDAIAQAPRDIVTGNLFALFSKVLQKDAERLQNFQNQRTNQQAAEVFPRFVQNIHKRIFVEQTREKPREPHHEPKNKDFICIYNIDGYIQDSSERYSNAKKSTPLFLDDSKRTPIGYNFHVPSNGDISTIIVRVYGGKNRNSPGYPYPIPSDPFTPDDLGNSDHYLMNRGVAIVTLNLPDLLENTEFQLRMKEGLHEKIQDCIHKFYQTLKLNPGALDEKLINRNIENAKIYLLGHSFGGLISLRHAEMYPDDFTGYISLDGALNLEMLKKSDLSIVPREDTDKKLQNIMREYSVKILSPGDFEKINLDTIQPNEFNQGVVFVSEDGRYKAFNRMAPNVLYEGLLFDNNDKHSNLKRYISEAKGTLDYFTTEEVIRITSMKGHTFISRAYLDPSEMSSMQSISKPVLITQVRDDNNVNAKVATEFYKKMLELGKTDLIRFWITESGDPGPGNEIHNKGHYIPQNKEDFIPYCESILNFVNNGPSALPEISELEGYRLDKLANKHYKSGSFSQKFIAEALEKIEKALLRSKRLTPQDVTNTEVRKAIDYAWEAEYKPLFYGMAYAKQISSTSPAALKTEIDRIKSLIVSDDIIIKTLRSQENIFIQYYKETYPNSPIPKNIINKEMIKAFKDTLDSLADQHPDTIYYFLSTIYKANPSVLQPLYPSFSKDQQLQTELVNAHTKLIKVITKGKTKLLNSYQAMEANRSEAVSLSNNQKILEYNESVVNHLKNIIATLKSDNISSANTNERKVLIPGYDVVTTISDQYKIALFTTILNMCQEYIDNNRREPKPIHFDSILNQMKIRYTEPDLEIARQLITKINQDVGKYKNQTTPKM